MLDYQERREKLLGWVTSSVSQNLKPHFQLNLLCTHFHRSCLSEAHLPTVFHTWHFVALLIVSTWLGAPPSSPSLHGSLLKTCVRAPPIPVALAPIFH